MSVPYSDEISRLENDLAGLFEIDSSVSLDSHRQGFQPPAVPSPGVGTPEASPVANERSEAETGETKGLGTKGYRDIESYRTHFHDNRDLAPLLKVTAERHGLTIPTWESIEAPKDGAKTRTGQPKLRSHAYLGALQSHCLSLCNKMLNDHLLALPDEHGRMTMAKADLLSSSTFPTDEEVEQGVWTYLHEGGVLESDAYGDGLWLKADSEEDDDGISAVSERVASLALSGWNPEFIRSRRRGGSESARPQSRRFDGYAVLPSIIEAEIDFPNVKRSALQKDLARERRRRAA